MPILPNAHASILNGDIVGSSRNNKIVILLFIQLTQVLQHNIALGTPQNRDICSTVGATVSFISYLLFISYIKPY